MDHNNNPRWGHGPCCPLITHHLKYTWNNRRSPIRVPSQVQKTEDLKLKILAHSLYLHTVCICTFVFLLFGFCIIVPHVFFSVYHVNIFALCSRLYCYVFMIRFRFSHICVLYIYHSRPLIVVVYALSILYSATHCIIIRGVISRIIFLIIVSDPLSFNISGVTVSRVIHWRCVVRAPTVCL